MSRNLLTICLLLFGTLTQGAEPFRKTLSSIAQNENEPNWETSSSEVTPDCKANWSVRKYTLHGGKQEGVELIEIDNGVLKMVVVPTRGMGILSVQQGDLRLGWDSPVKEVVHPQFVNLQSRSGLGWLEGFNEWLCRCGLESNGHPGTDKFINNVGDESTMELTLHGKIANVPAQEVELIVDREAPYRITLRGRVDERMLFGPKLELATELSVVPGESTFRLADVVTNRGAQPQEMELLYHVNFGRPLLESGSKLLVPAERVTPFNANAAKSVKTYDTYAGPTPGWIEQVYLFKVYADDDGRTEVLLQNKSQDQAVSMAWSTKQLPHLTVWKNTSAIEDGYVTGIEPGTNFPFHRSVERAHGRVPVLEAGASHEAVIDFGIHVGKGQVKAAQERVESIRGKRSTTVDDHPADEPKSNEKGR